jgi:hypothetical protein
MKIEIGSLTTIGQKLSPVLKEIEEELKPK